MTADSWFRHIRLAKANDDVSLRVGYHESWALLIGINDYANEHEPLSNARNDATAMANLLKDDYKFDHVITLYDSEASQDAIEELLHTRLPQQVGPNDRLIFFFAGHGATRTDSTKRQRGYLVPQDAKAEQYHTYIDMTAVCDACGLIPAKHIFLILDCCFSGIAAVTRQLSPLTQTPTINSTYLEEITRRRAWQVLTAGAANELAADSGKRPGHSAFTGALLSGLEGGADQNGDGVITASELANFVRPEVKHETTAFGRAGQMPYFNYLIGSEQGDFVFIHPKSSVRILPIPLPVPVRQSRHWLWVVMGIAMLALIWFAWEFSEREVEPTDIPASDFISKTPPVLTETPNVTIDSTLETILAVPGENVLIVAQFTNYAVEANFNVAGRIQEAIQVQLQAADLTDIRVEILSHTIENEEIADTILTDTGATLLIWGEYDNGRVKVHFSLDDSEMNINWQQLLGAPAELYPTINLDVPREVQALAMMALGRVYRVNEDLIHARAAFAQALSQSPSDIDTVAMLTFYLALLDTLTTPPALAQAIEGYTDVIEMRPEWLNANYNRGLAYLRLYWTTAEIDGLNIAIDDFTRVLAVHTDYSEAYTSRALAYYGRNNEGDTENAIDDFSMAIQYKPDSYFAYYNRGLAYLRQDQRDKWIADFQKSLSIYPEHWYSHYSLCWGYALDGTPEEGLPHCERAVNEDPTSSSRDARGLTLAQLNRLDEAADDLELYVEWLDEQPKVWAEKYSRHIYIDMIASLNAGKNPVTHEVLEQLRQ